MHTNTYISTDALIDIQTLEYINTYTKGASAGVIVSKLDKQNFTSFIRYPIYIDLN